MNHLLLTADRATHLKIVIAALIARDYRPLGRHHRPRRELKQLPEYDPTDLC
jgi:hypothetical protein